MKSGGGWYLINISNQTESSKEKSEIDTNISGVEEHIEPKKKVFVVTQLSWSCLTLVFFLHFTRMNRF